MNVVLKKQTSLNNCKSVPNIMVQGVKTDSQIRNVLFREIEYNK